MATTTANQAKSRKTKSTRDKILEHYQDYVLTHGENPKTVYAFCKELKIEEAEFYKHFADFNQISAAFWTDIFKQNITTLQKSAEWTEFTVREKLLSFYYSFFEKIKNHRSYAVASFSRKSFALRNEMQEMDELKKEFKLWVREMVAEGKVSGEIASRSKLSDQYDNLYWYQFMFLMDFWKKDKSAGFERTDEAIEKTVNLSFDLIEKNALDSAFDFGKFMVQNFR